jgi:cell division protein ZapA (FtsZ GTPase activity inhibitor)
MSTTTSNTNTTEVKKIKTVQVKILDQSLSIQTDGTAEKAQEVADFVSEQLQKILSKSKNPSPYNAALITALNLAEMYFHAADSRNQLKNQVAEKSRHILGLLELAQKTDSKSDASAS